jgi:hypothetical protein
MRKAGSLGGWDGVYRKREAIHHSPRSHAAVASFVDGEGVCIDCFARIRSSKDDFRDDRSVDFGLAGCKKIDMGVCVFVISGGFVDFVGNDFIKRVFFSVNGVNIDVV